MLLLCLAHDLVDEDPCGDGDVQRTYSSHLGDAYDTVYHTQYVCRYPMILCPEDETQGKA